MQLKKIILTIVTISVAITGNLIVNKLIPFSAAEVLAQTSNPRKAEADQLNDLGLKQRDQSEFEAALQSFQQALAIYREIKDRDNELATMANIGYSYMNLGENAKAIEYLQQYLVGVQKLKNREKELWTLGGIGVAYLNWKQYLKAIEYSQQYLVLARELKNPKAESIALGNLGAANIGLRNYQKGIEYEQQRLAIVRKIPDRESEGKGLGNIGLAYSELRDYSKAVDYLQQSWVIAREVSDYQSEKNALLNLGKTFLEKSDYLQANEYFQQALANMGKLDREEEKSTLIKISNIYIERGNYADAIEYLQQGIALARASKDFSYESKVLASLAIIYHLLGDYSKSIYYGEQALAIARKIPLLKETYYIDLSNLSLSYLYQGNYNKAIDYLNQSLSIARKNKDNNLESKVLGNIAIIFYHLGDYEQAIKYNEQSLEIKRKNNDLTGQGNSLGNLAIIYREMRNYSKAIDYGKQVVAITQKNQDINNQAIALNNLARTYYLQKNIPLAESTLREAIKVQELLRNRLQDNDKISIIDKQSSSYEFLQKILIEQNKENEALEIAEQGRGRAFAELINFRLSDDPKQQSSIAPPNLEKIKQIAKVQNTTLVEYSIEYSSISYTLTPVLTKGEKFQVIQQGNKLRVSATQESKLYIWVVKPTGEVTFRNVDLRLLQKTQNTSLEKLVNENLKFLGVAIDPTRSPNNQQSFAVGDFVRRNNGEDSANDPAWKVVAVNPQNRTLKIWLTTWKDTDKPIEIQFAQVTKVSTPNAAYTELQQLHKLLIDPIADLLPKDPNARVTFIPQGSLFFVPFPALQDADRKYLIQKHTILTAPAIQVLDLTRKQRQKLPATVKDALIIGNPTMPKVSKRPGEVAQQLPALPNAEIEAKRVAQLFKTQPIIGNQATKSAILQQLPKARIVHFATHGLLDDFTGGGVPGAIALAPEPLNQRKNERNNGLLTASEIFDLKLNAELVVLSACNTGVGRITGDGVIGLSRSLISAGVPSVIVSLWSIPDAPTASLMTEFYQRLQQGDDKASALRQAMLSTIKEHPNPENWAAFTLIGESN